MGLMDRIKKATGTEDYNDYDDTYYDEFEDGESTADTQQQNAADPMAGMGSMSGSMAGGISLSGSALELKVVKPESFNSVSQIADHLLNKRTVVLNLENTNKETARRLIDFLSGVAYSIDGSLKKIATNAYVITPSNVDVGDAQLKDRKARQEREVREEPNPMASIENEDLSDF